jgi:hypothetical protein
LITCAILEDLEINEIEINSCLVSMGSYPSEILQLSRRLLSEGMT